MARTFEVVAEVPLWFLRRVDGELRGLRSGAETDALVRGVVDVVAARYQVGALGLGGNGARWSLMCTARPRRLRMFKRAIEREVGRRAGRDVRLWAVLEPTAALERGTVSPPGVRRGPPDRSCHRG